MKKLAFLLLLTLPVCAQTNDKKTAHHVAWRAAGAVAHDA